jgi:hypothetical protein
VINISDLSNSPILNKKVIAIIIVIVAIVLGLISIYLLISMDLLPIGETDGADGG